MLNSNAKIARVCLRVLVLAALVGAGAREVWARNQVVIIAGKGGTTEYTAKFGRYAKQLQETLVRHYGFSAEQITVLAETGGNLTCTALNVETTLMKLVSTLNADETLVVVLFGHGTADASFAKFNLVGADWRDLDFARLLERIPARRQIFVNTTAASAGFVEKLTRKERVVLVATRSAEEKYLTTFPEYFIEAFAKPEDSDFNKDQKISFLEAFEYTRDRVVRYYEQAQRLRPEHPLLDDNGDGLGSEIPTAQEFSLNVSAARTDGALAARSYFEPGNAAAPAQVATGAAGPLEQRKAKLLAEIEDLKNRKDALPSAEYERKLEELFITLARLNREIKQSKL